jgi:hypothetical protein
MNRNQFLGVQSIYTGMNETVDEPWSDGIDISMAGDAYFAPRTTSMSVYADTEEIEAIAEGIRQYYDLDTRAEAYDRAARMYLAHVLDENEELSDIRERFDAAGAIPPMGWMASFERPNIEPAEGDYSTGSIIPKTVATIKEMIVAVVESEYSGFDSESDFVKSAIRWLAKHDNGS